MRFNLPIVFLINEEANVVIAKFDTKYKTEFDVASYIIDHSSIRFSYDVKYGILYHSCIEKINLTKFSGKAKCHKDDTFDRTLGMKIAKAKLLNKFYRALKTNLRESSEAYHDLYKECKDLSMKVSLKEHNSSGKICRLSK